MYTYIRIFLNIIFSVHIMLFVLCFLDWPFGHWTSSWCALLWGRPSLPPAPEESPCSFHSADISISLGRNSPGRLLLITFVNSFQALSSPRENTERNSYLRAFPLALYSVFSMSASPPKVTWMSSAAFLDYLTFPSCLIALCHTFMRMPFRVL